MKRLAILALAAAALFATAGGAFAQYIYLGPGYGQGIGPRYERDYDRDYDRDDRRYRRERYGRTWNGCPPNYTIQDGVCKPYRGY
jgi:hypothetical protein